MADELKKVRKEFVGNVSMPVIDQILDDLLDDVLNAGEREAILEENNSKTNKARMLIDIVRNKGDDASWKMIASLEENDQRLFQTLGLPAQPGASEVERIWSPTLINCQQKFWNSKKNDRKIYPVTPKSIKSRVALLITNIKFRVERLNRDGAEADEQKMERLLRDLGYDVVKYTNRTGKQIDQAVIDFSKHPKLKDTDSVFVVIMSHGKLGHVLGVNWHEDQTLEGADEEEDLFPIDNIFKQLASDKCKALLDKPKVIIIQACRGEETGSVLIKDGAQKGLACDNAAAADDNMVDDGLRAVHKEKDFIGLLSCTPGTVAYRHSVNGSVLIKYVVEVLNTSACEEHIEELFTMVSQRFETFVSVNRGQMPNKHRVSLTKHFYLFPGI
ncbi:caspase a-like [Dunckerocampus dactyliophorus]|uniref:caspase a-like n=1 Tax=Dunckerocampus dactyliophorus TaxID=161453 RepID=UPI002406F759|nr:caspase a-like [Dunckerocampus dactyliophorus]